MKAEREMARLKKKQREPAEVGRSSKKKQRETAEMGRSSKKRQREPAEMGRSSKKRQREPAEVGRSSSKKKRTEPAEMGRSKKKRRVPEMGRLKKKTVNWLKLPQDILGRIFDELDNNVMDCLRFSAVCSQWRTFAAQKGLNCLPRILMMLPPTPTNNNTQRTIRDCFTLSAPNTLFRINASRTRGTWFCGCSNGWLMTLNKSGHSHLLNPLTKTQIQLPPLTMTPFDESDAESDFELDLGDEDDFGVAKIGAQYNNDWEIDHELDNFEIDKQYIRKVVVVSMSDSPTDVVVMLIGTSLKKLFFCKVGERAWTSLKHEWGRLEDVIYFKHNFYAISTTGDVVAWDINDTHAPKAIELPPTPPRHRLEGGAYLVESSGKLLKVARLYRDMIGDPDGSDDMENLPEPEPCTYGFEVFKFDETRKKWVKVKSLNDQILFLGFNHSLSFSASDLPDYRANSIYFIDDYCGHTEKSYKWRDMGVFSMEDGSIESFYPNPARWAEPLLWFTPKIH